MKDCYIGIDFGSTKTAVVRVALDSGGKRSVTRLNGPDGLVFSSMAAIPRFGGELVFGRVVEEHRIELSQTHEIVPSLKEYLGMETSVDIAGISYSPADIIGEYFKYIKRQVYEAHHLDIDEAAFAISPELPIYGREELVRAAHIAEIEPTCLVYNSTALYFATRRQTMAHSRVMCVDWGGGEASIGIYSSNNGEAREVALISEQVGGIDADIELASRIHSKIASAKPDIAGDKAFDSLPPTLSEELISESEKAKVAFSNSGVDLPISIKNYENVASVKVNITYRFYEEAVAPLIYTHILPAMNKALERAGLAASGIDKVVISGGSSSIPMFIAAIDGIFGEEKAVRAANMEHAVAYGAALADYMGPEGCQLSDDICVSLSDGRLFAVLEEGEESAPDIEFSLTEDSQEAAFHFSDTTARTFYGTLWVETKGFLKESMVLSCRLTQLKTVEIIITNSSMGDGYEESINLVGIPFKYLVKSLDERQDA